MQFIIIFQIIMNCTEIFKVTKAAGEKWRVIGMELGFTEDELSSITHEAGRTGKEDYYSAVLRRWLDWAPPNHTHPCIEQLSLALRTVGKEKQALGLNIKYGVYSKVVDWNVMGII